MGALLTLTILCAAGSTFGTGSRPIAQGAVGAGSPAAKEARATQGAAVTTPRVTLVQVESIIQPVVAEFLLETFAEADARGDALLIIELSTPGGMLDSTRLITSAMLETKTPVAVFVAPQGAHAASAGFFVLMAADVAAMAPGTNTGAAHPVSGQGQDIGGDMGDKVEQDTAAMIRSLAAKHGRDPKLAESAVLESRSFTADEALELGLIDLLAPDAANLVALLDGRELAGNPGSALVLRDAQITTVSMSPFQRVRSAIVHPNIAYLLLSFGGLGLYFEFSNPGAIFPGVLGAICLIVGLYATSVLPVNYAGLALIGLGILFFIAELKVPSFGLLTLGGVTSLVLGSLMLFRSADPALRVSSRLIVALAVVALLVAGSLSYLVLKSRHLRVATGKEGLTHRIAQARTDFAQVASDVSGAALRGKVFVHGELWNAVSREPVAAGQSVEITRVDGLTLEVRPSGVVPPATET